MIQVRDIFQVQFGRAKEAVELWKEGLTLESAAFDTERRS